MTRGARIAVAIVLGLIGTLAPRAETGAQPASPSPSAMIAAPEAVLLDQDSRRFAFRELRGKTVLVAFIYTSCHHVCPLIFQSVSAVHARARAEKLSDVAAAFVSVDPEIDSPAVLRTYAERRGADFATMVFLTGSEAELRPVWEGFGLKVTRRGRGLVDHPPITFLVDREGVIRHRYHGEMLDSEAVLADLRRLALRAAR